MKLITIANREFKNNFHSKYLLAMIILLAFLGITIILISNKTAENINVDRLLLQIASLSSLSIFLIPLMGLFISYDRIVGEIEQNTLLLHLSYPISRTDFLLGKFIGSCMTLFVGICIGYIVAVSPILLTTKISFVSFISFIRLVLTSVLLSYCFVAIGYLLSCIAKQRSIAAGMSISAWLFFIVLFDLGLIGLIINDETRKLSETTINTILMLNPVDIFRLLSLSNIQTNQLSAMQGLGAINNISPYLLLLSLLLWIAIPLYLSNLYFNRKNI